ncbi:MAG TPA: DUF488 domain-containing protein [Sulfuricaulis sp.]
MSQTLYTVGHGNRTAEALLGLLKAVGVDTLVDVRAQPRSRHNPHFNDDALRLACDNNGITYHWAGRQLGGLRTPRPGSPHFALNEDRRGFADHMDTDVFRQAAVQLQNLTARGVCAMLCAERDPAHCHRSLIADYLVLQGVRVLHLIDPGETREHVFSSEARRESTALVYDRRATRPLGLDR